MLLKKNLLITVCCLLSGCIPLKIAPKIKDHKVMVAKKFKSKLSKHQTFIFQDPKDANEFYNYINTKFELNHQDVEYNVPFTVNNKTFYFSFNEVEKSDKTLNLLPIVIDASLQRNNFDPLFSNNYISRQGNWYILIEVTDEDLNDALKEKYPERETIIKYLIAMKDEYLSTSNYLEALFNKKL